MFWITGRVYYATDIYVGCKAGVIKAMNSNLIKITFGSIVAVVSAYLGGVDGILFALLGFMTVDYISGVAAAVKHKRLSSEVGFWGLVRKVFILALVGIGNMIDVHIIRTGNVFRTAVALYYIGNEGISVLENCVELDMPIPKKLRDILIQLRDGNDEGSKDAADTNPTETCQEPDNNPTKE